MSEVCYNNVTVDTNEQYRYRYISWLYIFTESYEFYIF